jgi:uncharacterized integral membrane protein
VSLLYILMAVVAGAIAAFALQNLDPVIVRFLVWRAEAVPLALVILGSLGAGALLAGIHAGVLYVRLRLKIRRLEAELMRVGSPRGSTPRK